jgi:hypothetical protein
MIVTNNTDSRIVFPTGLILLPRQTKGVSLNIMQDSDNKPLTNRLMAHGKITMKPSPNETYEADPPASKPQKDRAPTRVSPPHSVVPNDPTRRFIASADRRTLNTLAARLSFERKKADLLHDDDLRLWIGSVVFDDPELYRD